MLVLFQKFCAVNNDDLSPVIYVRDVLSTFVSLLNKVMVQYSIVTYRQNQAGIARMILSKESERESQGIAGYIRALTAKVLTALVSYAGKTNCREARLWILFRR